jgi:uncharacterized protein YutE (UPF0331/DUF86 family)
MDRDVVMSKLENLRRCIQRVQDKTPASPDVLIGDYDLQDIIVLNLERAVQACVDIGLHVISELDIPVPVTMGETFVALRQAGCLSDVVADRMIKAVGFRNTAVHAYQEIDWQIVYRIVTEHLDDFREFARQVARHIDKR